MLPETKKTSKRKVEVEEKDILALLVGDDPPPSDPNGDEDTKASDRSKPNMG